MGEPGLVYPGEDRSTVLLSPDADDNNCENVLGTSCKTKVSMKGDYNVNLTIHNGIGDSDPERSSFFCKPFPPLLCHHYYLIVPHNLCHGKYTFVSL